MKCIFTDYLISGDFHQRFHRRDLLIPPQKKKKRHSKRDTRKTLEANPRRIHHSSTG